MSKLLKYYGISSWLEVDIMIGMIYLPIHVALLQNVGVVH
jgi:hypothetical protein